VELSLEISQRKAAEEALRKSEQHYTILLRKSDRLQEELRRLSREILQAQEEERKEISRELHDVIAQTLAGINVRLAHLAKDAVLNTKDLDRNIARTQEMVLKSVDTIHRFARNLRPAMLDDLGLIPALEAFMKSFTERTGVRTHLATYAGVDNLTMPRRTALFRVVQEALTNVGRHARASVVHISIAAKEKSVLMEIKDDGKSFNVHRVLNGQGMNHLGLLGMRERMEMVGGTFAVDSVAGQGTTVSVEVPLLDNPPQGKKPRRRSSKPIAVTAP
jgi:signal transduction histidine kinase